MTMHPPSPYLDAQLDAPGVDLEGLEGPARDVVRVAGTPLADLAAEEDDGQAAKLETLEAHVELDDGTTFDVRILNRDFVAWDLTRPKRKWPAAEDAPFLLNNFLAHSAGKRAGLAPSSFEEFIDRADVVKLTRGEAARPTR